MKTRRQFLHHGLHASLLLGMPPYLLGAKKSAQYRTALIGCGWWGMNILREAIEAGRSQVVGLCDVYQRPLEASLDEVQQLTGSSPRLYRDYEEMLEKEKPEVVIVATPDHWHALPCIKAMELGAHVFVEKPTSHTIGESQAMLQVARATGRTVQVGLHRRIGPHHVSGMAFLRSGKLGRIGLVKMFVTSSGTGPEEPTPHTKEPRGMDWDRWCGPAPWRPYCRRLTPGGWRNFLDYANGTLGDWGVHWIDQMLWWSPEPYPKTVFSTGGRPILGPPVSDPDRGSTTDAPDTQMVTFGFESFTAIWEHRKYAGNPQENHRIGAYFYGTEGIFHMGWRDGWTFYPRKASESTVHQEPSFDHVEDGHNLTLLWQDFIDAIDQARPPVADIAPAHRSSLLPMLGMISHRLGRSLNWDGQTESILGDSEAKSLMRRAYRQPWTYPSLQSKTSSNQPSP